MKKLRPILVLFGLLTLLFGGVAGTATASSAYPVMTSGVELPLDTSVASDGAIGVPPTSTGLDATAEGYGTSGFTGAAPSGPPGISPQTVIPPDTRVKVDSAVYPNRAVVLISTDLGSCTGFLYGPNIVATAGHCVHTGSGGRFATSAQVYPGWDGTIAPYGSCWGRTLYTVVGWATNGLMEYDYGAIKLDCAIGNTVGWFGVFATDRSVIGTGVSVNGYPSDLPPAQYEGNGFIDVQNLNGTLVHHKVSTEHGNSGSPMWNRAIGGTICPDYCAIAIHTTGVWPGSQWPTNEYNTGSKITPSRWRDNFAPWRDAP